VSNVKFQTVDGEVDVAVLLVEQAERLALEGTSFAELLASNAPRKPRVLDGTTLLRDKIRLVGPLGLYQDRRLERNVEEKAPTVDLDKGKRVGKQVGTSLLGTGVGISRKVGVDLITHTTTQQLVQGVVTSGTSGGFALALALIQAATDALNLRAEAKALRDELAKKKLDDMDIQRFMTALRTIMKDGSVFEKCVDQVGKLVEYHKEFGKAFRLATGLERPNREPDMDCSVAFELVYRVLKAVKHLDEMNKYLPIVSLYASFTQAMLWLAEDYEEEDPLQAVDAWLDNGNHEACVDGKGNPDLCYNPARVEEELAEVEQFLSDF